MCHFLLCFCAYIFFGCECVLNCMCACCCLLPVQAMDKTTPYPVEMGLMGLFLKAVAKYCDRKGLDLDRDLEEGETANTEQILICCW